MVAWLSGQFAPAQARLEQATRRMPKSSDMRAHHHRAQARAAGFAPGGAGLQSGASLFELLAAPYDFALIGASARAALQCGLGRFPSESLLPEFERAIALLA